jgi:hypothetical protein
MNGDRKAKNRKTPDLITRKQEPSPKLFKAFVSTADPQDQRRVFGYLRSADTEVRLKYFNAAIRTVTSDKSDLSSKKIILNSLAAFIRFSEEGLLEYAPPSLSIRDSAYDAVLDSLADYLNGENISKEEYREVFGCLAQMDYFRVKKTLMLGYAHYTYPHDADWYQKRLQLCALSLDRGDDFVAWHVLAFLFHGYKELNELLSDSSIKSRQIESLAGLLSTLDTRVPRWLLSNDPKVVSFACIYCNLRELTGTLPTLKNLKDSNNELVREMATATIKKFEKK